MKFIKLTLNAPLQSWGERARWDVRDTASMPTKSGLIGILGACMAYPRGDERLCDLSRMLRVAVRADRPGTVMIDFHTVQGTGGILLNAVGTRRSSGDTIITPKQYLQDARFSVFFWGDTAILEKCEYALLHPQWTTFLGRRSCVPAVPLLPVWIEAGTVDEAVCQILPEESNYCEKLVQVQIEMEKGEEARIGEQVMIRKDEVISADKNIYQTRKVRVSRLSKEGEHYVFQ